MFRTVANNVWAFDLEWVPDPLSGRRAYDLPADTPDADVLEVMWSHARTSEEEPQPFLKYVLCRVVSAAVVVRRCATTAACRSSWPRCLTRVNRPCRRWSC